MASLKRTKRRGMVLTGPNCGRFGTVDRINTDERTCRVTFDDGAREHKFLDDVEFVDESKGSEFGGHTPEEADLLEEMLG